MGWFPVIFRSRAERRVAAARAFLSRGEYNEARLELEGVDHPDATTLRAEAIESLVQLNLLEWRSQIGAGHPEEAASALDRARQFGASPERIKAFKDNPDRTVVGMNRRLPGRPYGAGDRVAHR